RDLYVTGVQTLLFRSRFQNGLVEQGATNPPLDLAIGPYIAGLARESAAVKDAKGRPDHGLLPHNRWEQIRPGEKFHLDWSHMDRSEERRVGKECRSRR